MPPQFRKAEKARSKLRLALIGPSGSGKSYTALALGCRLAESIGKPCAVIDTERGSASLYADLFSFDVLELEEFDPRTYVEAIHAAEVAGYGVIVVDSLSHAWTGKGGALELVDRAAKRQQSSNSFGAWREVTPLHNQLVDTVLGSPAHIIATIRTKTDYVQERDERTGKTVVRKVGLAPVQRDGLEYEFTLVGDMDVDNNLIISKTRIPALSGQIIPRPNAQLADSLLRWLDSGIDLSPTPTPGAPPPERPRAQVSDLYDTAQDAPLSQPAAIRAMNGSRTVAEAVAESVDPNRDMKRFWARAKELDFSTKKAVHEALGLELRDGALAEAVASGRFAGYTGALRDLEMAAEERRENAVIDEAFPHEEAPDDPPPSACPSCGEDTLSGDDCSKCGWPERGSDDSEQPELVTVPAERVDPADARRRK